MMCVYAKATARGCDMSDDFYDDGMKDSVFWIYVPNSIPF